MTTDAATRWLLGLLSGLFLSGCVIDLPVKVRLSPEVVRPPRCVFIFSPDGLDRTRFLELLEQGRLPHVKALFWDGGVRVDPAVSSLPTVTYANYSSLITGRFPGHHGITNNLWLDRYTLESHDYMTLGTYLDVNLHLAVPTMYDMLRDHFTVNIQCHTRRGATYTIDNRARFSIAWALGRYAIADRRVPESLEEVGRVACTVRRWPSVIMTYYPAVDEIGHRFGPDSPEYAEALEQIDSAVSRIHRALEAADLVSQTYFMLVSDHGMPPIAADRYVDLLRWLRAYRRIRVLSAPLTNGCYGDRFVRLDGYDAFVSIGADRCAQILLRGERGWPYPPTPEEVDRFVTADPPLVSLPAVDCVLTSPAENRVLVRSCRGTAMVERRVREGIREYRLIPMEGDPLELSGDPGLIAFVQAGWHDGRAWLRATIETARPDFVPQAVEMFDSPRMGDIVLFAAEGANFSNLYRGGHGSCLARDMRIVWMVAGPDLPRGAVLPYARLVDVAPTILGLLGEAPRLRQFPPIDGIDLSEALRQAGR